MGLFDEPYTCQDCGTECVGMSSWVTCDECGTKRFKARMEKARAGRDYSIEELGGACPTQAQGRTVDDRPYYFRARHGTWTLQVGQPGWPTDYCDWPTSWEDDSTYVAQGDDESHGWMEDADVLALLDRHLPVPSVVVEG